MFGFTRSNRIKPPTGDDYTADVERRWDSTAGADPPLDGQHLSTIAQDRANLPEALQGENKAFMQWPIA